MKPQPDAPRSSEPPVQLNLFPPARRAVYIGPRCTTNITRRAVTITVTRGRL